MLVHFSKGKSLTCTGQQCPEEKKRGVVGGVYRETHSEHKWGTQKRTREARDPSFWQLSLSPLGGCQKQSQDELQLEPAQVTSAEGVVRLNQEV